MIRACLRIVIALVVLAKAVPLAAQTSAGEAEAVAVDTTPKKGIARLIEFLTIEPNKQRVASDPERYYPAKIVFAPYVIYTPETSVGIGVGGNYIFKMPGSGDESRTRTSSIPLAVTYTLNNQVIFYSSFDVFSPDEKYLLSGVARAQVFPRLFYGVGYDTRTADEVVFESTQIAFEPTLFRQLPVDKLFVGLGVRYRDVSRTDFVLSETKGAAGEVPEDFGFISGARGSRSVGAEAAVLYDTRNSILNAQTGEYARLSYGRYGKAFGGTNRYDLIRGDARKFIPLGGLERWRDVVALQARAYVSTGDVPLVELAPLGSAQIMRGYYEGRYVDAKLWAAQGEYRLNFETFPVGFVGFAALGAIAPHVRDFSLNRIRTTAGAGVRLMVDPKERLNLRADFAVTGEGDFNFYIQIGEAF